jgi:hypothetical protein
MQLQYEGVSMSKFLVLLVATVFFGIFSASIVQAGHVTKIKAADLVTNGESFIAPPCIITSELARLAKADGYLESGDFRNVAKPGVGIATVMDQYKSCNPKPTYLVTDGAGIDLMGNACTDSTCSLIRGCRTTLLKYLEEMRKGGTKNVLWMIYPDPVKQYAGSSLKKNQDIWAVVVPAVMKTVTNPKVLVVDLRLTWNGHDDYTSDGIHCSDPGAKATAAAFWKAMKDSNFFDTGSATVSIKEPKNAANNAASWLSGYTVSNNNVLLSLNLAQAAMGITVRIATVSGRTIAVARKTAGNYGSQTVNFPISSIAPGAYCLEVQAGGALKQSSMFVR